MLPGDKECMYIFPMKVALGHYWYSGMSWGHLSSDVPRPLQTCIYGAIGSSPRPDTQVCLGATSHLMSLGLDRHMHIFPLPHLQTYTYNFLIWPGNICDGLGLHALQKRPEDMKFNSLWPEDTSWHLQWSGATFSLDIRPKDIKSNRMGPQDTPWHIWWPRVTSIDNKAWVQMPRGVLRPQTIRFDVLRPYIQ